MGLFDRFGGGGIPADAPEPGARHTLALYKYDACPFCQRVLRALDDLDVQVEMRDTRTDPRWRRDLSDRTGRTTVPMLLIDDYPLFESADIVSWLQKHAQAA